MTRDTVNRYLAARANEATERAALVQPNVFARSIFMVCEIEEISTKAAGLVFDLKLARASNDLAGMSAALKKLSETFAQGALLARCLSTVVDKEGSCSV
jgi:hypothetical protein